MPENSKNDQLKLSIRKHYDKITVPRSGWEGNICERICLFCSLFHQETLRFKFFGIYEEFRIMTHVVNRNDDVCSFRVSVFICTEYKENIENIHCNIHINTLTYNNFFVKFSCNKWDGGKQPKCLLDHQIQIVQIVQIV